MICFKHSLYFPKLNLVVSFAADDEMISARAQIRQLQNGNIGGIDPMTVSPRAATVLPLSATMF